MVLILGKMVGQKLIRMPVATLTESVPGKFYHIRIETEGIQNYEEVARELINGLSGKFKANVRFIRIDDCNIDIQLEGSPFAWAVLIPWIPLILRTLGIVMVLVAVYSVVAAVPKWAWATLGIGLVLLFFGPTIGRSFMVTARKR